MCGARMFAPRANYLVAAYHPTLVSNGGAAADSVAAHHDFGSRVADATNNVSIGGILVPSGCRSRVGKGARIEDSDSAGGVGPFAPQYCKQCWVCDHNGVSPKAELLREL